MPLKKTKGCVLTWLNSVAPNDKPRNVPRKVIVFHLPIGSVAPYSPTLVQQVAESVSHSLNITDLVVESRSFNKGQHAIYLFHGMFLPQ